MSSRKSGEPVALYEVKPGEGRPPFSFEPGALEFLPSDAPLPHTGDILLLPRSVTGDSKAQAFAWGGTVTPFRVVELEHLYFREKGEKHDHLNPKPAHYVRTVILVRRISEKEYDADPGQALAATVAGP